jgi:hypothetical protein
MKANRKNEDAAAKDAGPTIDRPFPYIILLICSVLLILAGLYLTISDGLATGFTTINKSGTINSSQSLSGPWTMAIGIGLGVVPVWSLLKIRKARKQQQKNRE